MDRGKLLKPELKKSIRESAISVIVFSERYASSKWCLDEVMMIIEEHETSSAKHEVVPVFYKVDPSDVRNQKGSFKEAFDAYDDEIDAETNLEKKRELMEKVWAWKDSLNKAATFTGLVYKDGYESRFIVNIVNDVVKKVDCKTLHIVEKLVGIEDRVSVIEKWLQDPSPDAVVLLIDGMGGIGKTTIAKYIFNSNFRKYDGSCFLAKINETSNQQDGLLRLQSQLLFTVLKSEKKEITWNLDEGIIKVTNAISNKKVLLILDDVATLKQLDALLGPQRFYYGSKVIITTRHKDLLSAFKVHPNVYSLGTLSRGDATELFSWYAFHQDQPIEPYIRQSNIIVHHCMGLPLAIKVLGSSLYEKQNDVWEGMMHKLEAIPDAEIQKVLITSYETLADEDKELFLHIACFFEGDRKDYIVKLLAHCDLYPVVGISNLMDRCLVYVRGGRVRMHQLIKKMGREVVRKESLNDPGKRSRLWHHEDCLNVLQDNSGTEKVEGLMLDMRKFKEANSTRRSKKYLGKRMRGENGANFEIGALENMKNLMLLQLNYVTFSGKCKRLPRKLRLLRWHGCSLEALPDHSSLEKLVVLDMSYSKLKCLWYEYKVIRSLKILNLSHSVDLIKTPDFGGLVGLERLTLKGCSSLIEVDESIAYLKELVFLDLTSCSSLREFPCVSRSPDFVGLPHLESLILKGCSSLIKVHDSIAYLRELVLLDLSGCRSLRDFPCLPTSLVSLKMSCCPNLGVLGRVQSLDSIPSFSLLKDMNLSYCNLSDDSFPNDWSSLVSLVDLYINGNNVTSLPKCIQTLPRIRWLSVMWCSKIQSILGLPESMDKLYIGDNESLEKVQPGQHSRIKDYGNCPKLCVVEGHFKLLSIDKVERKIIRYLGLESNAGEGMELGLKVLHEFGIFSTFISEKQIPSSCFTYKVRGSRNSFKVTSHHKHSRISGFSMCVVLSLSIKMQFLDLEIGVQNKTKDLLWSYFRRDQETVRDVGKFALLSLWRCGNLLEAGDEIIIRIFSRLVVVEECGINLIYEDDEQLDGETKEPHHVNALDQISWTDRMVKDISNYVCIGETYVFREYDSPRDSVTLEEVGDC